MPSFGRIRKTKVLFFLSALTLILVFSLSSAPSPSSLRDSYSNDNSISTVFKHTFSQSSNDINTRKFSNLDMSLGVSPHYDLIKRKYGDNFISKPLSEKCQIYFNLLYSINPNWELGNQTDGSFTIHSTEVIENLHHLNIYNHCYLNDESLNDLSISEFDDLDSKIYPYLTRRYPLFTHWNGEKSFGPPDGNAETSSKVGSTIPFWNLYTSKTKGKGIVISCADNLVNDTVSLLKNLRALGNTFPVEIVHRGDLSAENQLVLINEARKDKTKYNLSNLELFEESLKQANDNSDFTNSFPKLDLWFVDVSESISTTYSTFFRNYHSKFLAYLFNSFEEFIMLDCDLVIFKKLDSFFNSSQYKSSNSLFFKDRNLSYFADDDFLSFLMKSSPSEADNLLFNIPLLSNITSNSEFFQEKYYHYMESGVVTIDKSKFWKGMLISAHLSLVSPTLDNSWGDKEFYWMGQLISGNENYAFDSYWTGAVGEYSVGRELLKSKEVCSTHPAHISSDDDRLWWLNSGALVCPSFGLDDLERELPLMQKLIGSEIDDTNKLTSYFKETITIKNGIIPPKGLYNMRDLPDGAENEPNIAFSYTTCCRGYLWCAHESLALADRDELIGKTFDFNANDALFYNYITDFYVNG